MTIRLNKEQKIKVRHSDDAYQIMQQILLRQQRIDRNREHFWVMGLAADNSLIYVELISMGCTRSATAEPMEIYCLALRKRSVTIIIVHSHTGQSTEPSEPDKTLTNQTIQIGLLLNILVLDHLIITEETYYSFANSGLLDELAQSREFVLPHKLEAQCVAAGEKQKALATASAMKKAGELIEKISLYTGLSKRVITALQ